MKLARVRVVEDGAEHLVVAHDDGLRPVRGVRGVRSLIGDGCESLAGAVSERGLDEPLGEQAEIEFLSPLESTGAFRDFYAFEQHVKAGRAWRGLEMDPDWYRLPVFYFSNPYAIQGPGDVHMTPGSEQFDFELEVGAILGGGGRDLTSSEAAPLIVGYTVLNDWSGRDVQKREMGLSMGPVKGKDTATSIGPWVVTPDELADRATATGFDLRMTCTVNGRRYSDASWSDVYWSFPEMVAYASRGADVRPGDLFGSGTCGTGCINELSRTHSAEEFPFLRPGDVVEAEIERLGALRNVIVEGSPVLPVRAGL
ncbi:fumarylacetoacetate hydrolase family protein (plasmid) [Herbiconiux sp. KACC 21604]|uniref:fumarylacetoacetate hydrolase family protein n=1 Tax=unclassified Herbiconiux TaxID=2618217 RepID=UPI001492D839|nr:MULTISPECIES: fumarylacetoacetate hydrolase family protein [unclassified Herbiconiux]QJU56314.1 fumarylacetoacetate hydrolase family protein [Herbiconiux sp. SALV-R1]WPO88821.1 fumarylacetoacetate hydrolase family protein [Herbiconiux sp. KACC 21604]